MVNNIQSLAASGPFRIVCDGNWAKSFPPGPGIPPFYMGITFDNRFASIYERWQVDHFEEGYMIKNNGNRFWACKKDDQVFTSNEFDPANCKWYIQSNGPSMFKIAVPNEDLVWTVKNMEPDYPLSAFLEPANGSSNQEFSFATLD